MRRLGILLEVVGAVVAGGLLVIIGAGNATISGDLVPVPLVGTWPIVVGGVLVVLGLLASVSERAAAAAAGTAVLPLVLGLSFLGETDALNPFVSIPVGGAVLAIAGAAIQWLTIADFGRDRL